MTLVEMCEPVFQYVCRLNRLGRKGGRADFGVVRSDLKAALAEAGKQATSNPQTAGAWPRTELVLMFFIDSMILNSKLGPGWKPLSHERGELGFEEKFWDLLEDDLKDPSPDATQRLGVFYTCIGLGFTGLYTGQPDYLRRKMLEVSARISNQIDADQSARICNEAYENADTRNLTQPPNRSLTGLVIGALALTVVLVVAYVQMFKHAGDRLGSSLRAIQTNHEKAAEGS